MKKEKKPKLVVQFITTDVDRANNLLRHGWKIIDHKLAVASGGMSGKGLSSYGVEYVAGKVRIEARTIILELEDAKECDTPRGYGYSGGCRKEGCQGCHYTGYILNSKSI